MKAYFGKLKDFAAVMWNASISHTDDDDDDTCTQCVVKTCILK